MVSGDLNIDEMISDELSTAFFGFSLRRLGAELAGEGRGINPPPPHVMENPDIQQGAG